LLSELRSTRVQLVNPFVEVPLFLKEASDELVPFICLRDTIASHMIRLTYIG